MQLLRKSFRLQRLQPGGGGGGGGLRSTKRMLSTNKAKDRFEKHFVAPGRGRLV